MNKNFFTYALLFDLDRWIVNFDPKGLPDWIFQDGDLLIPFLQQAEQIVLEGKTASFDKGNPSHLTCIFNYLSVKQYDEHGNEVTVTSKFEPKTYPFQPLSLKKEHIFPTNEKGNYQTLCDGFLQDFKRIPGGPGQERIFGETLYYLLKKYCWCIPVSEDLPYIQLFEFLKVRAAIAMSLYASSLEENPDEHFPLLFYCVDQSGIQPFIYNITSNRAAKSLKGRSFYLHLLMDTIKQKLFNDPDIHAGMLNVLYASGGKMYLILPNTTKVNAALDAIEKELLEQLYDVHRTELYLKTARLPVGRLGDSWIAHGENEGKNTGELLIKLAKLIHSSAAQPYRALTFDKFTQFFTPNPDDGFDTSDPVKKVCAVTGETIAIPDENSKEYRRKYDMSFHESDKEDDGERIWVKEEVKRQADLGYKLQWSDYYKTFYADKKITDNHRARLFYPLNVEVFHGMAEKNDVTNEYERFGALPSFTFAIVQKINGPDEFLFGGQENLSHEDNSAYGFSFYGGNKQATSGKETNYRKAIKDYSMLTGLDSEDDKHRGFHRLGVLRMDVDGLGAIFSSGMPAASSIAAYATISSELDLFFSGYLNTIRESLEDGKDYLNIIYSGGDDIFAVGRWDVALSFAETVRREFKAFVNDREEISISGGLALVGPKFPISKAAHMAGEAEDAAKEFPDKDKPHKNAFSFFEQVVSWQEEYDEVKQYKSDMVLLYDQGFLTSGFFQKMIAFQLTKDLHLREITKSKDPDYSFLWTSSYFISRFQERFKKVDRQGLIHQFLDGVKKAFFTSLKDNQIDGRIYDKVALAARWAEFEIRLRENNKV